jgi:hypothetical protein
VSTIPTQASAHSRLARLHRAKATPAEIAAAYETLAAAQLRKQILAALAKAPITSEHREELADLIRDGGAR